MSEGASSSSSHAAVRLSMKRRVTFRTLSLEQRGFILVTPCAMLSSLWMILTLVDQLNGVVKFVVGRGRFLSM